MTKCATARGDEPLLHWSFDDRQPTEWRYGEKASKLATKEIISGTQSAIEGLASYVPGVSGSALKFDGFSTYVDALPEHRRDGDQNGNHEFSLPESITIEAWIALAAYPWNWTPILATGNYKITGFYFGVDSRGRVGLHVSDGTSVWHECNTSLDPKTKLGLDLRKWHHVVGTYSPRDGLKVYVNGRLAAEYNDFQFDYGIAYRGSGGRFRIGQNRVDLPPSDPIRDWATYPSKYSFDGIIDELKVYAGALSPEKVAALYNNTKPDDEPALAPRTFPTVEPSGRFGANYTRLSYYPEWDALWPPGDDVDVVVQFDEYPTKLIFWRGTRYSPCWVSENKKWMADQSRETSNNWYLSQGSREELPTGCVEHMSDTQCRSSRVAIIENNDARCVINWRYLQMDVRFRQRNLSNNSGVGEWGNEYYYVYPDGICVRKVLPGYGGWQETIFLNDIGTRPEDNVELKACTLVNMNGQSKSYSWEDGYPKFDLKDAVIQMTNFKSRFKPFIIFRDGGSFDVFNVEVRPEYSHFPWWNHWPVSQVISDGRSANAADRASHSSLSWGEPAGDAALYGMTDRPPESLASLARSWNFPPNMTVLSPGYDSAGFDYGQRVYVVRHDGSGKELELVFNATEQSPIHNLALVLENWASSGLSVELNDKPVPRGKYFRLGTEYDVKGNRRIVVFLAHNSARRTRVTLAPDGSG
jgi:concanavalin A-like lectin/glucanase superfamily protein